MPTMYLVVLNLKGGTGKTTSAVFAAHALHELGRRVLFVDADPQASAYSWHQYSPFPFPVVCLPTTKLHREVPGIAGDGYDVVVVDCPPTAEAGGDRAEHGRTITASAVVLATHVLVPVAPAGIEVDRMGRVRELLVEASERRRDEAVPPTGVLLVKAQGAALSTEAYRVALADGGWRVLRGSAPIWQRYSQAFGEPVGRAAGTPYGWAVCELLDIERDGGRHAAVTA